MGVHNQMENDSKEKTVSEVLELLKLSPKLNGYSSIHFILSEAWKDNDVAWTKYDKYISMIALKSEKEEAIIVIEINKCMRYLWRRANGDYEILKCMFGYPPDLSNQPTWVLFMRTILSVLFYCEENNIDAVSLITGVIKPDNVKDEYYNRYLAGYIILLLRNINLPDSLIDKATTFIDRIIDNSGFTEAFIAYIKYTSIFFAVVEFDGIVIPPEYYNMSIAELFEGSGDSTATRIANYLPRYGVKYLKDFRYKSSDDVKGFRSFGSQSYERLIRTLKQKVQN